jgi:hypothetical protein
MSDLEEAALWALEHFVHLDEANSKIHCAPVRYSPITFRLAEALARQGLVDRDWAVAKVMKHVGEYELDMGR